MPNSLRAGTIPGTTRALACRWMRPRIQPRRGAHAAGVPFSAARRKLRPTNLLSPAGMSDWETMAWAGRPNLHAGRVRSLGSTRALACRWMRPHPASGQRTQIVEIPYACALPGFSARARKTAPEGGCAPHSLRESQRDSGLQPKVARHELPWVLVGKIINPNGVAACLLDRAAGRARLSPARRRTVRPPHRRAADRRALPTRTSISLAPRGTSGERRIKGRGEGHPRPPTQWQGAGIREHPPLTPQPARE